MDDFNKVNSDEEEDLEALRLAALQTLQKKKRQDEWSGKQWFNGAKPNKRGKFFGRGVRNNQNWARNSNLISVPMVQTETEEPPKLELPQDRYNRKSDGNSEKVSKFDRYDNSDESDEEENNDKHNSDSDSGGLKRENSLDDLMEQLENEINSDNKEKVEEKAIIVEKKENVQPRKTHFKPHRKWNNKPINCRNYQQQFVPPPIPQFVPTYPPQFDNTYNYPINGFVPLPPIIIPPQPSIFDRPAPMAPLSPRSAQFVMENRAIIEKRKRKSYSRSPSPYYRSKRASLSPPKTTRKSGSLSPEVEKSTKRMPIHNRLGGKSDREAKAMNKEEEEEEKKTAAVDDAVLEARRKKFETNEISKEGVIRLKKTNEEKLLEEEIDENLEMELLEDDEINLEANVFFSDDDDESDSDTNEGRFKTKQQQENKKVAILPFTKLINDVKPKMKKEHTTKISSENKKRRRSRTPKLATNDRKIEIKIRNPLKYNSDDEKKKNDKVVRKIEIEEKKVEIKTTIEKKSEQSSEGDLRAQLSRKRAERQKHPIINGVPSRLLQDALQGAVFKKTTKTTNKTTSNEKEETSKEGKLPIHLRLGVANMDVFTTSTNKKKRKSKQV